MIHSRAHPPGFTLIELLLALAISIIILSAVQSIVTVAAKSVPAEGMGPYGAVRASVSLEQLGGDLETATMILFADARQLEMVVPDQDGDGFADGVRYSWSGNSGDPLIREYRGNSLASWDKPQVIITRVDWMEFDHERGKPVVISDVVPDTLLASFEPATGVTSTVITSTSAMAQGFRVTLPSTALTYRVTRVAFRAGQSGTVAGSTSLTLGRVTGGGLPDTTVLATSSVSESRLAPTRQWIEIPVNSSAFLSPGSDLTFALRLTDGSASAEVEYGTSTTPGLSGLRSTSVDGVSFTGYSGALVYRVYGVFTTSLDPAPESASRYHGCTIRYAAVGGGSGRLAELTFMAPNRPQSP